MGRNTYSQETASLEKMQELISKLRNQHLLPCMEPVCQQMAKYLLSRAFLLPEQVSALPVALYLLVSSLHILLADGTCKRK